MDNATSKTETPLPNTIGSFRILGKLGQGGMGTVYRAMHGTLERPVALKVLPAEFASNTEYVTRFLREARTIATLRNENVVQVYDAGEQNGQYYIAMEFVDGCSLLNYVDEGKVSEPDGLGLMLQAAKGLSAAHVKGLVHRDIKPENMLIGKDRILRIVDFGLVMDSNAKAQITMAGTFLGTPLYMSPEQVDGEIADQRSDIYSLGITFYRVFTGQAPFVGTTVMNLLYKHKFEDPPDPQNLRPDLSLAVRDLLLHMIAKKREDRPASAAAVANAIEKIIEKQAAISKPHHALATQAVGTEPPAQERPTGNWPVVSKEGKIVFPDAAGRAIVMDAEERFRLLKFVIAGLAGGLAILLAMMALLGRSPDKPKTPEPAAPVVITAGGTRRARRRRAGRAALRRCARRIPSRRQRRLQE